MFYVYVLRGPKQLYIGSAKDLKHRVSLHNKNMIFSTKKRGPWHLIYYEASTAEKDARLREKYLKTAWGRRYLRGRLKNDD